MEPIFMNVNVGTLMGTIVSDIRKYSDKDRGLCVEFDVELKRYVPDERAFRITCVSLGTQAELILKTKGRGDTIVVFGYLGDVDIGHGTTQYGNHKFRVTSVHFQYGSMLNFSGKILTQPEFRKNRAEFIVGTYRRHETVPVQPCKMKVICAGKIASIMKAFRGKKNVLDTIFVIGYLTEERGSLCIHAQRLELLLPDSTKKEVFSASKKGRNEQSKDRDKGNSNNPNKGEGNANRAPGNEREGSRADEPTAEKVTVPAVPADGNNAGSDTKRKDASVA